MNQEIVYYNTDKSLEWHNHGYSFCLPDTVEQLLEIDKSLQVSVNHARIDLILEKILTPLYVTKEKAYRMMILLRKTEYSGYLLDYFCGKEKTVPAKPELEVFKLWCCEKKIGCLLTPVK